MPKKIIPDYPDRSSSSTVAVRLSKVELLVLDYMVKQSPGEHSRGGLLRAIFRDVVRPSGLIVTCASIKDLRLSLQKKSLLKVGMECEIEPSRVVCVMPAGKFSLNAPLVSVHDYWVMGAGYEKTRFDVDLYPADFEESRRFCSCTICFKGEFEIVKE